jgi:dihydroorotate dehydrogenase (NAD+) catalytic subunit
VPQPDLAVSLGPLRLRNPLIAGAGEHLATEAALRAAVDAGAAAVVAKSSNETEAGRRQWRAAAHVTLDASWRPVAEGTAGPGSSIFNRSGLQPEPWAAWVAALARADAHAAAQGAWVVPSLIPADLDALAGLVGDLEAAGLRWIELNLSAPHAREARDGVIRRPADPGAVAEIVGRVRAVTALPLTAKLTAESDDVAALAAAAREAGADVVAMTGRFMGFLPDPATRRPLLGTFGAISGTWTLPLAARWLAKTRIALGPELPLVGTGGARSGEDVARLLLSGACAVQVATAPMVEGMEALGRIRDELAAYLAGQGVTAQEIVGEAADHVRSYADVIAELEEGR